MGRIDDVLPDIVGVGTELLMTLPLIIVRSETDSDDDDDDVAGDRSVDVRSGNFPPMAGIIETGLLVLASFGGHVVAAAAGMMIGSS